MTGLLQVFIFILGAAVGSFLNVVAGRLQSGKSFVRGRSHCPFCGATLRWYDLWPILSWLVLKGKCRYCRGKIAWRYLLIEIACAGLFLLGAIIFPDYKQLFIYLVAVSFFVVLFIYDGLTYIVPDKISLPAIVIIFFLNIILAGKNPFNLLLAAGVGGAWFLIQFLLSRGRWVGGGDIRLGVLIGVLLGFPLVGLALLIAYVGGSIIALLLILTGKKGLGSRLPFATILLPATLITWLWGTLIWDWYINLLGF
ncbi:MAG: prepilin peptidase [Candidatus Komeilibacteria bacterium]|nr:prepilin peptidase [Candidatus Komeilibacteria bacterium]